MDRLWERFLALEDKVEELEKRIEDLESEDNIPTKSESPCVNTGP